MKIIDTDQDLARDSYYATTARREQRHARLEGSSDCDVAIVGAGIAGLSAAIDLADSGFRVVVLEAREVGSGASGRNGGQAIHGLACDQQVIEDQLGLDEARRVWWMTIEALDTIRERCARFAIDCEWHDGFLGVAVTAAKGRQLQDWAERMAQRYGYPMRSIAASDIGAWIASRRYVSAVYDPRSGHLHPLKYAPGLARAAASLGVAIHEHTVAIELIPGQRPTLRTAQGMLRLPGRHPVCSWWSTN